jgi:histidinol phosphatase-like enzyme
MLTKQPCRIYTCYAYQSKKGNWGPTPNRATNAEAAAWAYNDKDPQWVGWGDDDPMWSQAWRKPNAGMLLQAMADAGVSADDTIFVGNSDEDKAAAAAAGITYIEAKEYFYD